MVRFLILSFPQILMVYFIVWAVFLLGCILAMPIASMMEKRNSPHQAAMMDDQYGQDDYQEDYESMEPPAEDDGFGGEQAFPAEEMPDMGEPVADDFSAFDNEFN